MADGTQGDGAGVKTTHDVTAAAAEYDRLSIKAEYVPHPEDGHTLLNPHTLEPVLQVRPDGAYQREKDAAQRKVDVLKAHLDGAQAALDEVSRLDAEARWSEIVAALVAADATIDPSDRERAQTLRRAQEGG